MGSYLGSPVRADAEGRFEIKALPPGRQYSINTSAKGFGQDQRNVPASDTATNRVELEPFQLEVADQRIAGVVLDDNDKPVASASVYSHGTSSPTSAPRLMPRDNSLWTRFAPAPSSSPPTASVAVTPTSRLKAATRTSSFGSAASRTVRWAETPATRLKGKPLPDLAPLGLTPEQAPADQALLAVLIDAEQRPSRRALRLLGEQAAALKEKGVAVIVVHAGTMTEDAFKAWKQEAAVAFPVGCLKGDAEKARARLGRKCIALADPHRQGPPRDRRRASRSKTWTASSGLVVGRKRRN